jgi:hypothetical protein
MIIHDRDNLGNEERDSYRANHIARLPDSRSSQDLLDYSR